MDLKAIALTSNTQSMTKNCKERSAKKTKELSWARFQRSKVGSHQIQMLKQVNTKTSKSNSKTFTIQSCKKLIKALHKEETVVNNITKDINKAMQDPAQMK